jgi:hypothetical protein
VLWYFQNFKYFFRYGRLRQHLLWPQFRFRWLFRTLHLLRSQRRRSRNCLRIQCQLMWISIGVWLIKVLRLTQRRAQGVLGHGRSAPLQCGLASWLWRH